jgi:hypothetical protein
MIRPGPIIYGVAAFWPIALAMSGVGSDWQRISLLRKIWLTAMSCLFPLLLRRYGGKTGTGCGVALGIYCGMAIFVMWFLK